MAVGLSTTLRNTRADAIATAAGNNAKLRFYTGSRPATGAAITSQTLLAELTCGSPFAGAAVNGVLTLNSISSDTSADATGTAVWARIVKSDGTTFIADCSVGISDADIILNTNEIVAGATVTIVSATMTEGSA